MDRNNDALRRDLELIGIYLTIDLIATFRYKQYLEAQEYADLCFRIEKQYRPPVPSFLSVEICKQFEEDL